MSIKLWSQHTTSVYIYSIDFWEIKVMCLNHRYHVSLLYKIITEKRHVVKAIIWATANLTKHSNFNPTTNRIIGYRVYSIL